MPPVQRRPSPVFDGYFADPFVFRHAEAYYAIGTGPAEAVGADASDQRVFPMLRSVDFARWEVAGPALERPDRGLGQSYWAPEIVYDQGSFFLYYSVGHGDEGHHIRVATSREPTGPFRDT